MAGERQLTVRTAALTQARGDALLLLSWQIKPGFYAVHHYYLRGPAADIPAQDGIPDSFKSRNLSKIKNKTTTTNQNPKT